MMEQMPKAVPLLNDFAINKIYLFLYFFAIYPALLIIALAAKIKGQHFES